MDSRLKIKMKTNIEGKTKVLVPIGDGTAEMHFKNTISRHNSDIVDTYKFLGDSKGEATGTISSVLMEFLKHKGVPVHFIEAKADNVHIVKMLKMIPLEVVVRFKAYGSYLKRYETELAEQNVKSRTNLDPPVVEFFQKIDDDPLIEEKEILRQSKMAKQTELAKQPFCTEKQLKTIKNLALKSAELVKEFFAHSKCELVDLKLEFGTDADGNMVLGDEISPDSFRLHKEENGEIISLDKDIFRNAKDITKQEVYNKLKNVFEAVSSMALDGSKRK